MKLKHIIRIIIFAALVLVITAFLSVFLSVPSDHDAIGVYGFTLEPEDSIDVIMIGPSEVYTSFYSPLGYEQQGFTSYSLATASMTGATYKSAVQLAESTQKPQLYVVELWGFSYEEQYAEAGLRKWVDSLPDGQVRTDTIKELVPEDEWNDYLIRINKYHSRWSDFNGLKECLNAFIEKAALKKQEYSISKNFATTLTVCEAEYKHGDYPIYESGMKELKKFLEFMKSEGIENVLFVRTPEMYDYEATKEYEQALQLIDSYGYDFLNAEDLSDEIGIDDETDFYNVYHLNMFGTVKYTTFLSQYIMDNYDINTEHSADVTEEWDYCASYNDQIISNIEKRTLANEDKYVFEQSELTKIVK